MTQEYFGIQLSQAVRIGLPLVHMETVTRFEEAQICSLPGVAPFWLGVVNQGGSLLWVLDTDEFFGLTSVPSLPGQQMTTVILICPIEGTLRRVALKVQGLEGILTSENLSDSNPLPFPLSPRFKDLFSDIVPHHEESMGILATEVFFQSLQTPEEVTSKKLLTP